MGAADRHGRRGRGVAAHGGGCEVPAARTVAGGVPAGGDEGGRGAGRHYTRLEPEAPARFPREPRWRFGLHWARDKRRFFVAAGRARPYSSGYFRPSPTTTAALPGRIRMATATDSPAYT